MKTAMQELIEVILREYDAMGYPLVVDLEPFLKKEKEQIFEFADRYVDDVMGGCVLRANEYYEKHYSQEEVNPQDPAI